MKTIACKIIISLLIAFITLQLSAQVNEIDSSNSKWNFSAWAEMFIIPGDKDLFNPTFYARHKKLHLEGRYNYEDRNTVSFWAGQRFELGNKVRFVFVPMVGLVFGNTNGIAPGLEMEISCWKLDFYSESEYVLDYAAQESNFFYMYSELAVRPIHAIRLGGIGQRTKVFETPRETQYGMFGEYYFGRFRVGVFYFSPFADNNYWIASASVDF
jgi:hypothetical protein